MNERRHAHEMIQQLSPAEREALAGLVAGESVSAFARRFSIDEVAAADIRECMKWKLGLLHDAEAVRIAQLAELEPA